jgi:hypothetical protein
MLRKLSVPQFAVGGESVSRIDADGRTMDKAQRLCSSEGIGDGAAALTDPGQLSDDQVSVPRVGVAFAPGRTLVM